MLYALCSILLMLALLDRVTRRERLELAKTKTRYRLYCLRDSLRSDAALGKVSYSRLFDYHDTSITRTIDHLDTISLWDGLYLVRHYSGDKEMQAAYERVRKEMRKKENRPMAEYHKQYGAHLHEFLTARHQVLIYGAGKTLHFMDDLVSVVDGFAKRVQVRRERRRKALLEVFRSAPETSTLMQYCGGDGGSRVARHAVAGAH